MKQVLLLVVWGFASVVVVGCGARSPFVAADSPANVTGMGAHPATPLPPNSSFDSYGAGYGATPTTGNGYGATPGNCYASAYGYGACPSQPILPSALPTPAPSSTPSLILPSSAPSAVPLLQGEIYTYRDNFFKNYGINPFVETATDHLSTFAADVDTASFTYMRKALEQGKLPEPASVRTEEFLNYFNYRYPQPTRDKFAIHTEMAPSYFGDAQSKLLRVGIQGLEVMPRNRKDAILTFVIDVSGSMNQPNRLDLAKQSLSLLVNQLGPNDKVAIVIFGLEARTVLTHSNDKQAILNAIASLRPEGSTNAEAGLLQGYAEAAKAWKTGASNRIILCSDGVANVGTTGPDAILARIKQEAEKGLSLSTVGFGMGNYNDTLMEQLANKGDGTYAYVDTLAEAQRIFVQNLTGTLQTIAKDVKIQVDFNPNVVVQYRLLGYENRDIKDEDFRDDAIDAGEVGANHSVTALYEVRFQDSGSESQAANVVVRYKDVDDADRVHEIAKAVLTSDLQSFENASSSFKLATAAAEYAEILRKSIFAQDGQLKDVSALAQAARDGLPTDPKVVEFVTLVSKAEGLFNPSPTLSISAIVGGSNNPKQLPRWTDFLNQQLCGLKP
jgi:Ca-activated chloride channel homolog